MLSFLFSLLFDGDILSMADARMHGWGKTIYQIVLVAGSLVTIVYAGFCFRKYVSDRGSARDILHAIIGMVIFLVFLVAAAKLGGFI